MELPQGTTKVAVKARMQAKAEARTRKEARIGRTTGTKLHRAIAPGARALVRSAGLAPTTRV